MRELLDDVDRWRSEGKAVALVRVVAVVGSGPCEPGASMAVSSAGEVAGAIAGGCVEGAVVEAALEVIASGDARRCAFGCSDAEAIEVGLSCGGTIEVFVEPVA